MSRCFFQFLFLFCFVIVNTAYAYTDPGSGALIWQLLLAGFVGFLFYFKQTFAWVKSKISKKSTIKDSDSPR